MRCTAGARSAFPRRDPELRRVRPAELIVLDTSALVAILQNEPERGRFDRAIEADPVRLISAATLVETALVIENRHGTRGAMALDQFLAAAGVTVVPLDASQAEIARIALRRYGKGRHPAALNFGDCFAYALAKSRGEFLLFKGDDFTRTDIASVL